MGFKALQRIKKSFKSIDFDIAKNALVFNVNHCWNLSEKFQVSKWRWAHWEVYLEQHPNLENTTGRGRNKHYWKSGNSKLETADIQLVFLYPRHFGQSSTCNIPTSLDNLHTSHNHISSKGIYFGLWNPGHCWNKYETRRRSTTFRWQEWFKEMKDNS